jgi:hypothetical protein
MDKIEEIQNKLPSIQNEFIKYFVYYSKNPNISEYQRIYQTMESYFDQIKQELQIISKNMDEEINKNNEKILIEKQNIDKLKKYNQFLKHHQNNTNSLLHTSYLLYNDYYDDVVFQYIHYFILTLEIFFEFILFLYLIKF